MRRALLLVAVLLASCGPSGPAATTEAPESPTPAPLPTVWRLDGVVIDESGKPIQGVCVGLGPAVCTDTNPRTDAKGRWFIDLPKAAVDYEFHFTKAGFKQFDMPIRVVTPQTFRITLAR